MESIKFDGCNVAVAEGQEEYQTLHAKAGEVPLDDKGGTCEGLTFCMKLSPEELAEIARTGVLWHTVLTFGQPLQPQCMSVQRPEWV